MMFICFSCKEFRLLVEFKTPSGDIICICRDCFADERAEADHAQGACYDL